MKGAVDPCTQYSCGEDAGGNEAASLLHACRARASLYTPKEVEFLRSVGPLVHGGGLSRAQMEWLKKLAEREPLDFDKINQGALAVLPALCQRWLPTGGLRGKEWVSVNPTRADGAAGSFAINTVTGKWADFATGDKGGDPISLAAYLFHNNDQGAAARDLKRMLGQ